MTYKELFYFTGHCLALDEHPLFRERVIELFADARNIQNSTFKIQNFIQLCSDHLIIPAIYLKLKAHDILKYLPEDFIQAFKEIYDLNRERNQQILRQIDDITAVLNKENIQPVFLKGAANLLDGIYSDVGERMIGDIDFLVKEEDYFRTAAILEGKGYKHDEIYYTDLKSRKHYPSLCKEGEIAPVEIHWLPVRHEHTGQYNAGVVLRDQKAVPEKPGLYVPSDEHKLIHTFIHDQLEDRGYAYKQSSFRGLYDLYLLSKRIDVTSLVDQTGYRKKAISWLVFAQRVLDIPNKFYTSEPRSAKWFCLKYELALTYVRIHNTYISLKIGKRYSIRVLKAIFNTNERLYVYRRLKYSKWYLR
ncbi:MAG TPA: hypothetical protein DCR40_19190 [Prolixibacteraceae bacterium]|nr:hypothetical protein [Prolixibacteraceae bacterium]